MKTNKYVMQSVAYFLLAKFKLWVDQSNINVADLIKYNVGYIEYHNFWKARLPVHWYEGILLDLGLDTKDVLVEIAKVKGDHAKDLHYHKISHAICIVLGPQTGFPEVSMGRVVRNADTYIAEENLECYFPTECRHTFHGGVSTEDNDDGSLYFISIQSPPLLSKENDDFYFVNER